MLTKVCESLKNRKKKISQNKVNCLSKLYALHQILLLVNSTITFVIQLMTYESNHCVVKINKIELNFPVRIPKPKRVWSFFLVAIMLKS